MTFCMFLTAASVPFCVVLAAAAVPFCVVLVVAAVQLCVWFWLLGLLEKSNEIRTLIASQCSDFVWFFTG